MDNTEASANPLKDLALTLEKVNSSVDKLGVSVDSLTRVLLKRTGKPEQSAKKGKGSSDDKFSMGDIPFLSGFADVKSLFAPLDFFERHVQKPLGQLTAKVSPIADAPSKVEPSSKDESTEEMLVPAKPKSTKENAPVKKENPLVAIKASLDVLAKNGEIQSKLLSEAISIKDLLDKKLISKPPEPGLPKGIEPNTEEQKTEDREKLAESIAQKLAILLQDLMSNGGFNFDLPGRDKGKKPKPGDVGKAAGAAVFGVPAAVGLAGAALSIGATNVLEGQEQHIKSYSKEQDPAGMLSALSGDTGAAASIINEYQVNSPQDIEIQNKKLEEERKILEDAPFLTKYFGVGREEYLKQYKKQSANTVTPLNKNFGEKLTTDVEARPTETSISNLVTKLTEENIDIKNSMITEAGAQLMQPIVSNKVINNTEQKFMGISPSPNNTTNSLLHWQNTRSNFTDR